MTSILTNYRQAILVLGLLVFVSHLIVSIGVFIDISSVTFIGRVLFGLISAGLLCKRIILNQI